MFQHSYNLRIKAIGGLVGFLILVAAFAGLQLRALQIAEGNHRVLGELTQLEAMLPMLADSVSNYVENAPRDYESYFRDVAVFMHDLRANLDRIETEITALEDAFAARVGVALPAALQGLGGVGDDLAALDGTVVEARSAWDAFLAGLDEQLGEDEDEPRIEWGAKFVSENLPALDDALMSMSKQYRMFLDNQSALSLSIVRWGLIALLAAGLLGIAWFYRRVIRRIGKAAEGCVRVANGDFGYTLGIDGDDEITELSRAFNSLSSRSELVVKMLSDLQQASSVDHALQAIVSASGVYLPMAWAGLVDVDRDQMQVVRALPNTSLSNWPDRRITAEEAFGKSLADALVARKPVILNDLRNRALEDSEGPFLRGLVRATQLEALVAVPLSSAQGWEGILLFGSKSTEYGEHQADLLTSLAPTLALSFQRASARRAA
ncbi:MAG: HAMP domain-containing protein [Pseudomonadota bacterium]